MGHAVTIGLDIAKSVFQVHGVDSVGGVVIRRQVRRAHLLRFFAKLPKCLIGVERFSYVGYWRILTVKRSPKIVPAASAVRGIATLREHTVSLKVEGVKNSKKSS